MLGDTHLRHDIGAPGDRALAAWRRAATQATLGVALVRTGETHEGVALLRASYEQLEDDPQAPADEVERVRAALRQSEE